MLEARDRMTRPLQDAARASQQLQGRVNRLSGEMNHSRSAVEGAARSTVTLSQRYRDLSQRLSQASENTTRMQRVLRSLPRPVRAVALAFQTLGSAIMDVVKRNVLVRSATRATVVSFKLLTSTVRLSVLAFKALAKGIGKITGLDKVFNVLIRPIKAATRAVVGFGRSIIDSAKNSRAYLALKNGIQQVGDSMKTAARKAKEFGQSIKESAKNTAVYRGLAAQVDKVKNSMRSAKEQARAFVNSNQDAQRLVRAFQALGNTVAKPFRAMRQLRDQIRGVNNEMGQLNSRRATFNQLADANSRLNREVSRLNAQLSRAKSSLSSIKSSASGLNMVGGAFAAAYAGQAAFGASKGVVEGTVGTAMDQQYSEKSVGILAGADKGAKYWKQIQDYASTTAYSASDWAKNMRSAIKMSSNTKDLKKYQQAMEQLATLDPVQGLEGAALAIRELNSGDITSLVERFELPRSTMKDIKNIENPIKQIEALTKLVGENTGYTVKNIGKMKELPLMQWQKFSNSVKNMFGYMGKGALEVLGPAIEKMNSLFDSGKLDPFISKVSTVFGTVAQQVVDFATKIATSFQDGSLQQKFQPIITLFTNITNTIQSNWPTISAIFSDMVTIFNNVAAQINAVWPTVNGVIATFLNLVKNVSTWIVNNWPMIAPIVAGVVAAIGTLKIASAIAVAIDVLRTAITLWRSGTLLMTAAQWALNTALYANPIGIVVAVIVGLIAALVTAYNTSETFRDICNKLWSSIRDVGIAAFEGLCSAAQAVGSAFSSICNWVQNAWDKFMGFVNAIKSNPIGTLIEGAKKVGSAIGVYNPGKKHHGGLNRVPYDGYQATLHKGERVLTRQEANEAEKGSVSVPITGNTFYVRQESDIDAIATALFNKLNAQQTATG